MYGERYFDGCWKSKGAELIWGSTMTWPRKECVRRRKRPAASHCWESHAGWPPKEGTRGHTMLGFRSYLGPREVCGWGILSGANGMENGSSMARRREAGWEAVRIWTPKRNPTAGHYWVYALSLAAGKLWTGAMRMGFEELWALKKTGGVTPLDTGRELAAGKKNLRGRTSVENETLWPPEKTGKRKRKDGGN